MHGPMPRLGRRAYAAVLGSVLTSAASNVLAHGDHGDGGGTVLPAGVTLISVDYDDLKFRGISEARSTALAQAGVEEVHSLKTIAVPSLSIAYGITRDLTIAARLPSLANKDLKETDPDAGSFIDRGGVHEAHEKSAPVALDVVLGLNGFWSEPDYQLTTGMSVRFRGRQPCIA